MSNGSEQRLIAIEDRIAEIRERASQDRRDFLTLQTTVADLADIVRLHHQALVADRQEIREIQTQVRDMQVSISEMLTEIRGIQTENQRMLRYLFGENNN